eukprot:scaffold229249_cov16-Tisochrysis_lutea.AAC.1
MTFLLGDLIIFYNWAVCSKICLKWVVPAGFSWKQVDVDRCAHQGKDIRSGRACSASMDHSHSARQLISLEHFKGRCHGTYALPLPWSLMKHANFSSPVLQQ